MCTRKHWQALAGASSLLRVRQSALSVDWQAQAPQGGRCVSPGKTPSPPLRTRKAARHAASSARYARATRPLAIAARSVAAQDAAAAECSPLERLAEAAMSRSSAMV